MITAEPSQRLVTVSPWTLSMRPTCTPKVRLCARSLPSWISRRPRSAISYVVLGSLRVADLSSDRWFAARLPTMRRS